MFINMKTKHIPVGVGRGKCWSGCFVGSTFAYCRNARCVVRRYLKNGFNLYVICRYNPSYEEVQQVRQLSGVRRPVCRSASAEMVTAMAGDGINLLAPELFF